MNIKNILGYGAAAILLSGCVNAVEPYDAIYMTDAQVNPDKSITIDEVPAGTVFTVSSSVLAQEDISISLEVRGDLLDGYNRKYGKNYVMAPEGSFELSTTETMIKAGYNTSTPVEIVITSMADFKEGTTYCVPVGIKSASDMTVLEPSRTLFVVLKTPVFSKAIKLGSSNIYTIEKFKNDESISALSQVTLEARIYMEGFMDRDPYISSVMGIEGECMVRFGDVKVPKNCIQICHESYQPAATGKPLSLGTWYHVAAVWSGSTWDIYIDGQYVTGTTTAGETMNLAIDDGRNFYLGASYSRSRPLNGYIAEARVWTKALTQSEIANNMNYVDPQTPGLLAYWRMNAWEPDPDGSGNVVKDETGHGYDAHGDSNNPTMMDTKWM